MTRGNKTVVRYGTMMYIVATEELTHYHEFQGMSCAFIDIGVLRQEFR
jgi:hypothetical protein